MINVNVYNFQNILTGESKVVLTGGVENMSQAPFVIRNVRFGTVLGQTHEFEDSLWLGLLDTYCNLPMGMTAEKLGSQYSLKREEVDEFALRSQQLWKAGKHLLLLKPILFTLDIKNEFHLF